VPSRGDDFQLFLRDPPILTRVSGRLSLYREGARGRGVPNPIKVSITSELTAGMKTAFHPGVEQSALTL